jgi:hypothetical protein
MGGYAATWWQKLTADLPFTSFLISLQDFFFGGTYQMVFQYTNNLKRQGLLRVSLFFLNLTVHAVP